MPIRRAILRDWAVSVMQEAGAIRECEEHGWMQDRADPDARARALDIAGQHPPASVSRDEAIAEIKCMDPRSLNGPLDQPEKVNPRCMALEMESFRPARKVVNACLCVIQRNLRLIQLNLRLP